MLFFQRNMVKDLILQSWAWIGGSSSLNLLRNLGGKLQDYGVIEAKTKNEIWLALNRVELTDVEFFRALTDWKAIAKDDPCGNRYRLLQKLLGLW